MKQITVRYGVNITTHDVDEYATVGQLLGSSNFKAKVGCGDNVRALLDGVSLNRDTILPNGGTIVVETAANQKAVTMLLAGVN